MARLWRSRLTKWQPSAFKRAVLDERRRRWLAADAGSGALAQRRRAARAAVAERDGAWRAAADALQTCAAALAANAGALHAALWPVACVAHGAHAASVQALRRAVVLLRKRRRRIRSDLRPRAAPASATSSAAVDTDVATTDDRQAHAEGASDSNAVAADDTNDDDANGALDAGENDFAATNASENSGDANVTQSDDDNETDSDADVDDADVRQAVDEMSTVDDNRLDSLAAIDRACEQRHEESVVIKEGELEAVERPMSALDGVLDALLRYSPEETYMSEVHACHAAQVQMLVDAVSALLRAHTAARLAHGRANKEFYDQMHSLRHKQKALDAELAERAQWRAQADALDQQHAALSSPSGQNAPRDTAPKIKRTEALDFALAAKTVPDFYASLRTLPEIDDGDDGDCVAYAQNAPTEPLRESIGALLRKIDELQQNSKQQAAQRKKQKRPPLIRYHLGLRAAKRFVQSRSALMVVVATDLEQSEAMRKALVDLQQLGRRMRVPVVYALGRDALALVLQRPKRSTSFVSVVNADGAEPELKQAIAHWNDARNEMRRAAERAKAAERKRLADAAENSVEFKPQK